MLLLIDIKAEGSEAKNEIYKKNVNHFGFSSLDGLNGYNCIGPLILPNPEIC